MYKISTDKLLKITNTLKRGHEAIHAMERVSNYKRVYMDLRKNMQDLIEELEDQYALKEFSDVNARDKTLNKIKKEADDNWAGLR